MARALILTYHAVEAGPAPLCVTPSVFREHLERIVASGARSTTVSQLADALADGTLAEPTVAITFDDAFASVCERAAPLLAERGLTATVFCVAGHVGGRNDWPSAHPGGFESRLAGAAALAELTAAGFEIGSHGMHHEPLVVGGDLVLRREIVESRLVLEELVSAPVRSFAYPYGAGPSRAARRLVEDTYRAGCTTVLGRVAPDADPLALPRVDVHYVRRPELLERALAGSLDLYFRVRGVGARAHRVFRKDYATAATDRTGATRPSE